MNPVPKLVDCNFSVGDHTLASRVFDRLEPGWRHMLMMDPKRQPVHDAFLLLLPTALGFVAAKDYVRENV